MASTIEDFERLGAHPSPEFHCEVCSATDPAGANVGAGLPEDGDLTTCWHCEAIVRMVRVSAKRFVFRRLTTDEMRALTPDSLKELHEHRMEQRRNRERTIARRR